eukprot:2612038-Pyramimonas_sp.AAC.1
MEPGQLIELVSGVYGLGDAPLHFRKGLKRDLVSLGYRQSTLDPTVFMLFPKDTPIQPLVRLADLGGGRGVGGPGIQARPDVEGIVVVEVDDIFDVGGPRHQEQMNKLRAQRRFGKVKSLMDEKEGAMFNGRHYTQDEEFNFHVTMRKFIEERLSPIHLGKGRGPQDACSTGECSQARA